MERFDYGPGGSLIENPNGRMVLVDAEEFDWLCRIADATGRTIERITKSIGAITLGISDMREAYHGDYTDSEPATYNDFDPERDGVRLHGVAFNRGRRLVCDENGDNGRDDGHQGEPAGNRRGED